MCPKKFKVTFLLIESLLKFNKICKLHIIKHSNFYNFLFDFSENREKNVSKAYFRFSNFY